MKAPKYYFLLLLSALVWLSCEKKMATPPASAPAATPTATAKDTPTLQVNLAGWHYYSPGATYKHNVLSIGGQYIAGPIATDPFFQDVELIFYAKTTGTYLLSTKNWGWNDWGWHYEGTRGFYQTDSVHVGFVILTTFDTIKHVASGTFNFVGNSQIPIIGLQPIPAAEYLRI